MWCRYDQSVEDAAMMMIENRLPRVLVMGPRGRFMGVVSVESLAAHAELRELAGRVMGLINKN
jgi:hypothetical protein